MHIFGLAVNFSSGVPSSSSPRRDRLHVLRPGIDQRDVVAEVGEGAADIAAERPAPTIAMRFVIDLPDDNRAARRRAWRGDSRGGCKKRGRGGVEGHP